METYLTKDYGNYKIIVTANDRGSFDLHFRNRNGSISELPICKDFSSQEDAVAAGKFLINHYKPEKVGEVGIFHVIVKSEASQYRWSVVIGEEEFASGISWEYEDACSAGLAQAEIEMKIFE